MSGILLQKGHTRPTCVQTYKMEICLGFTGLDVAHSLLWEKKKKSLWSKSSFSSWENLALGGGILNQVTF